MRRRYTVAPRVEAKHGTPERLWTVHASKIRPLQERTAACTKGTSRPSQKCPDLENLHEAGTIA